MLSEDFYRQDAEAATQEEARLLRWRCRPIDPGALRPEDKKEACAKREHLIQGGMDTPPPPGNGTMHDFAADKIRRLESENAALNPPAETKENTP